jgi:hypothetical protein
LAAEEHGYEVEGFLLVATPIFVFENGDVTCFDSEQELDAELEAIDVREGRYVAYDAHGRRLLLEVSGRLHVSVQPASGSVADTQELASRLRRFIRACGEDPSALQIGDLMRRTRELSR